MHSGDRIFRSLLLGLASGILILLGAILFELWDLSSLAWERFGPKLLFLSEWDPVTDEYGILPFAYGTVASSLLALVLAAPISIGVALFLGEVKPGRVSRFLGFLVEMLAAIPSVVYGLWGIFVLAPGLRTYVQPVLGEYLGFLPLFDGPPYGVGMMAAALILAIMIIPTITTLCREVFRAIPLPQREAALALGATRWETIRISVLGNAKTGIFAAMILGLGRALGETMAVTMVIGNRAQISASLFEPGATMASVIANEYAEAVSEVHLSVLAAVGMSLFLVTLVVNGSARWVIHWVERSMRSGDRGR